MKITSNVKYFYCRLPVILAHRRKLTDTEIWFTGAIFSEQQKHSHIELAFKYAVHKINRDRVILPKTTLVYDIQYVPREDSFHATKKGELESYNVPRNKCIWYVLYILRYVFGSYSDIFFFFASTVCNQVKMGVHAIFGPSDPALGAHIYSICDALDIPYLDARIDTHNIGGMLSSSMASPKSNGGGKDGPTAHNQIDGPLAASKTFLLPSVNRYRREFTINLNPTQILVNNAFQDVIRFLNWTNVAVIYERNYGKYAIDTLR